MGQPVVHFEIVGANAARLQRYYAELFGWEIDASSASYGIVPPYPSVSGDGGLGIGGGVGAAPDGHDGHVTIYVEVPDVETALVKAESLGGTRMFGPSTVTENVEIGQFTDPEGHLVGVVKAVPM